MLQFLFPVGGYAGADSYFAVVLDITGTRKGINYSDVVYRQHKGVKTPWTEFESQRRDQIQGDCMGYVDREKRNAYQREFMQKKVMFLKELKETTPCADCGMLYPYYVMDFDHLGDKFKQLSSMRSYSFERIKQEVAKCEIVCANCHRKRTHSRSPLV